MHKWFLLHCPPPFAFWIIITSHSMWVIILLPALGVCCCEKGEIKATASQGGWAGRTRAWGRLLFNCKSLGLAGWGARQSTCVAGNEIWLWCSRWAPQMWVAKGCCWVSLDAVGGVHCVLQCWSWRSRSDGEISVTQVKTLHRVHKSSHLLLHWGRKILPCCPSWPSRATGKGCAGKRGETWLFKMYFLLGNPNALPSAWPDHRRI